MEEKCNGRDGDDCCTRLVAVMFFNLQGWDGMGWSHSQWERKKGGLIWCGIGYWIHVSLFNPRVLNHGPSVRDLLESSP